MKISIRYFSCVKIFYLVIMCRQLEKKLKTIGSIKIKHHKKIHFKIAEFFIKLNHVSYGNLLRLLQIL